jgi:Zn-dependent protease
MKWSFKLGRIAGIALHVHVTFVILLAWIAVAAYSRAGTPVAALAGAALTLAIFAIVVLHELGHALAARRFGIATRDITLLPIGGVARLERMPDDPRQELVVALAGPTVNVLLALALLPLRAYEPWNTLLLVNVSLAVFNLLPAFPMDGGRALRALLAMRLGLPRATTLAARIGQGLAMVLGAVGLAFNPLLILIALFVWVGAAQEATAVRVRAAFAGVPVRAVMMLGVRALAPDAPLAAAVDARVTGPQQDFPVVDERGAVVGLLDRDALVRGLAKLGRALPVTSVMRHAVDGARPDDMVADVLARMERGGGRAVPVVDEAGVLVGLLTAEHLADVLALRDAQDSRAQALRGAAPATQPVRSS